jgi:hypothetical protein
MSAQASAQSATGSPLGSYLTSWSHKAPDSAGEEMIVVNYEVSSLLSRDLVCPYFPWPLAEETSGWLSSHSQVNARTVCRVSRWLPLNCVLNVCPTKIMQGGSHLIV